MSARFASDVRRSPGRLFGLRAMALGACLAYLGRGSGATPPDDLVQLEVSRLRLRAEARVAGGVVTVADCVAASEVDARLCELLADLPLHSGLSPGSEVSVSHADVTRALARAGVNLSRVLLGGSGTCRVRVEPAPEPVAAPSGATRPPVPAGPERARTLADALRERAADDVASLGGMAQVAFESAAREFLELTSPPFEFDIRGAGGTRLGLREYSVSISRDGRFQRSVRVTADVRLVRRVLVAARPLNVGSFVRREDLTFEERAFDRAAELVPDDPAAFVGKQVERFVAQGRMLTPQDVKAVDLVKRSMPVTVVGSGAGVDVRLTGVALDSGDLGDSVRVRLGEGRGARQVLRGTVAGMATVRLEEQVE